MLGGREKGNASPALEDNPIRSIAKVCDGARLFVAVVREAVRGRRGLELRRLSRK